MEISKGTDLLLAQYSFRGGKLRIVYTALGTTFVEYYELLSEGLKDKDGSILYSKAGLATTHKKLYDFIDVFKAAAIELNVEKIRNLSHPLYLSCVNDELFQRVINIYFEAFNNENITKVRIEDVSKETVARQAAREGVKMAVFPVKSMSVNFSGADGKAGGFHVLLSFHNGEWKWVSFCQ